MSFAIWQPNFSCSRIQARFRTSSSAALRQLFANATVVRTGRQNNRVIDLAVIRNLCYVFTLKLW